MMEEEEKQENAGQDQSKMSEQIRHTSSSQMLALELLNAPENVQKGPEVNVKLEPGDGIVTGVKLEPGDGRVTGEKEIESNEHSCIQNQNELVAEPVEQTMQSPKSTAKEEDSLPIITSIMSLKDLTRESPVIAASMETDAPTLENKNIKDLAQDGLEDAEKQSGDTLKMKSIIRQQDILPKNCDKNNSSAISCHTQEISVSNRSLLKQVTDRGATSLINSNVLINGGNNTRIIVASAANSSPVLSNVETSSALTTRELVLPCTMQTIGANPLVVNSFSGTNTTVVSAMKTVQTATKLQPIQPKITTDTKKVNINASLPMVYVKTFGPTPTENALSGNKSKHIDSTTVNMDSVAPEKLLELFRRQNPSPPYKPDVKKNSSDGSFALHTCFECGDMFLFEKSLLFHKNRHSMEIDYDCSCCGYRLLFHNKCSFMAHLRLHRNKSIVSGQIHIKSECLAIKPLPYKKPIYCEESSTCAECSKVISNNSFPMMFDHFFPGNSRPSKTWLCCTCQMTLPSMCSFMAHKRLHEKSSKLVCPECGKCFKIHITEFLDHLTTQCFHFSRVVTVKCDICPKILTSSAQSTDHFMSKHIVLFFECEDCTDVFRTYSGYIKHTQKVPKVCTKWKKLYACVYKDCGDIFETEKLLRTHLSDHYADNKGKKNWGFLCIECYEVFESRCLLKTHYSIHKEKKNKINSCVFCNEAFTSKEKMVIHFFLKHHTLPVNVLYCDKCHCNFSSDKSKQFHICGNIQASVLYCDKCSCIFATEKSKQLHSCSGMRVTAACSSTTTSIPVSSEVVTTNSLEQCPSSVIVKKKPNSSVTVITNRPRLKHTYVKDDKPCIKTDSAKENPPCSVSKLSAVVDDNSKMSSVNVMSGNSKTEIATQSDDGQVATECRVCHKMIIGMKKLLHHIKRHQEEDGICICRKCQKYLPNMKAVVNHQATCGFIEFNEAPEKKQNVFMIKNPDDKRISIKKLPEKITALTTSNKSPIYMIKVNPKSLPVLTRTKGSAIMESSNTDSKVESVLDDSIITPKLHQCKVCGDLLPGKLELLRHEEEHQKQFFPCHLCSSIYTNNNDLQIHFKKAHEGRREVLQCHLCKKKNITKLFSASQFLEKHINFKHRSRSSKNRKSSVSSDERNSPSPETKNAPSSSHQQETITTPAKRLHLQGDENFVCAKCSYQTGTASDFYSHVKTHSISNTVQCYDCGLSFTVLPTLKRHLFIVHKIKNFEEYCKLHDIKETEAEIEDFYGNITEMQLQEKKIVEKIESRSSPPSQKCAVINRKRKLTEENEENDAALSDDRTSLKCSVCHMIFVDESSLKSHMRTHGLMFLKKQLQQINSHTGSDSKEQSPIKKIKTEDHIEKGKNVKSSGDNRIDDSEDSISLQCKFCLNMFIDVPHLKSHMEHCSPDPGQCDKPVLAASFSPSKKVTVLNV